MSRSGVGVGLAVAVLAVSLWAPVAVWAEIKPEHRKQLTDLKKDLNKVTALITKNEIEDATKVLDESETKLKQICTDAGIQETDRLVAGTFKLIELKRGAIAKKTGAGAAGVTFEKDVAPILTKTCLRCHSDDPTRGGLNMNTFAGIIQGGTTGRIVAPGNPAASLIVRKITATGMGKMPPGNASLTADEIKAITAWVAQGAKFGGDNSTPINQLASATPGTPAAGAIDIPKPTGNETVSFTKDIAPWVNRLCGNCHGANNPRSGFSVTTFESMMKGGNSGRVLLPGNRKDSRLWHLVGEQDPLKMPPGQALITETNWEDLKTWIDEGCKFDGSDAKTPLRDLVAGTSNDRLKELAARTPAQWEQARKDDVKALWDAFTKDEMKTVETKQFLVVGDAPEARLKQVGQWADDAAKSLGGLLSVKDEPMFKGKLALFVMKERFGFSEFTQTHEMREAPAEQVGYARVNPTQERAYAVLYDVGDDATEVSPGMRAVVTENVAAAVLQRQGRRPAEWIGRGLGLVLAARNEPKNIFFKAAPGTAAEAVRGLQTPLELFDDGSFATDDHASVSYTLVGHMLAAGDAPFARFVQAVSTGSSVREALQSVYNVQQQALYNSYYGTISGAKPLR